MVKTPHTRHSKTTKEPVTIDLAPGEVARVKAEQETGGVAAATETGRDAGSRMASDVAADTEDAAESLSADVPEASGETTTGDSATEPSSTSAEFDTETSSQPERASAADASRRGGVGMPLAAGLAGGVLALVVAGGLQFAGLLSGSGDDGRTEQEIAAIETRLDELQGQVSALSQASGDASAMADRLTAAEQEISSLTAAIAAVRDEMSGLEQGEAPADLGPLEDRIAAIETAIAGLGGAATPEAALATLDEQIETLRTEISSAREAQSATTARLDALERSVSDLAARLDQQAETPGTAVIIAASALKAAIDRGGPFMTELETFASLAPDAPEVAQLREMAAAGVPTRAQIAAESDAAANAMIVAARPPDPEAGIFDRLWGSAMGLVQVRPIGMVEGEGVAEIVARIDAAVTSNDYQRAIDEFETLPDTAKAVGEPFIARVKARHGADALIDQALAAALKA